MDSMTFQSIYAALLDGKRLTLSFPSPESAENFRVRMAKYKTAQEDLCAIVDMKIGSEKKEFAFRRTPDREEPNYENIYQFQFRERPAETRYEVLAVETVAEV